MEKLKLAALQGQFRDVLKRSDRRDKKVVKLININAQFSREDRIEVYRYAYLARLVESMQEDFPIVEEAVGEKKFAALVGQYLELHPSRSWTLAELGVDFPEFLGRAMSPLLKSLAALELARVIAFLLEAPPPFDFSKLAAFNQKVLFKGKFGLNPTLRTVEFRNLATLKPKMRHHFKRHDLITDGPVAPKEVITFAIFRSSRGVQTYRLPRPTSVVLETLSQGEPIGKVLEVLVKKKMNVQEIFGTFSDLAARGLITGFKK